MRAASAHKPRDPRVAAIAKVQIARKELKLADDDYRALLVRVTGKSSAGLLNEAELGRVVEALKGLGFKPRTAGARPKSRAADHPMAGKARALWLSLWQLGVVREPGEAALEAFARRQLGCARLQWADQAQGRSLIEALKAMAERAGWSQDLAGIDPRDQVFALKVALLDAQDRRLGTFSLVQDNTVDALIAERGAEIRRRGLVDPAP